MKRRVHVGLRATNSANATAHATALNNALAGKQLFEEAHDPTVPATAVNSPTLGGWFTFGQWRFQSVADADAFWAEVVSRFSIAAVQPGSWRELHDCPHDEGEHVPCVLLERFVKP